MHPIIVRFLPVTETTLLILDMVLTKLTESVLSLFIIFHSF